MKPLLLWQLLERAAETQKGLRFFDRKGGVEEFTYRQLLQDSAGLSGRLQGRLRTGDRAGLIFSTSYDFVKALFAVSMSGAVPFCLAPPRLGRGAEYSDTAAAMIRRANAVLVLCEESSLKSLERVQEKSGVEFAAISGPSGEPVPPVPAEPGDPALLQFSSGTTMEPRPVVLSHANLFSNTQAILSRFPGDLAAHSGLSWLPMHHDMGLIGGLFTAVAGRGWGSFVRPEDFVLRPGLWLSALSRTKSTISPCPNFALKLCTDRVEEAELDSLDLSNWQIALVGAETVHLDTLRAFARKFEKTGFRFSAFTPVYGLAESTLAVSFSSIPAEPNALWFDRARLAGGEAVRAEKGGAETIEICSVGTTLDGINVAIRSETGDPVPEGRTGRIFVAGSSLMKGYLSADGGIDAPPEYFDTGDLGFFFGGELFICGRVKDIIIINGRNYDPAAIEFATEGVPGLRHERTAAFALETNRGTEGFAVLVEREKGENVERLPRLVQDSVVHRTGLVPDRVIIIDTGVLPRTTSGKVRRQEARNRLLSGRLPILAEA